MQAIKFMRINICAHFIQINGNPPTLVPNHTVLGKSKKNFKSITFVTIIPRNEVNGIKSEVLIGQLILTSRDFFNSSQN